MHSIDPRRKVLFIDVETVPVAETYDHLPERWQKLWKNKARILLRKKLEETTEEEAADMYQSRAGIYSEFGRVVCISCGILYEEDETRRFRIKSFSGQNEAEVLKAFASMLENSFRPKTHFLCGHNIKEFDIPYLCRRMLVHEIALPEMMQLYGKKPWEVEHILDTMTMWKFGDYKNYTSLETLTALFDLPSPKSDLDGSQVARVFYEENDLDRIVKYCEQDVVAVANVFLRMAGQELILPADVVDATGA